MFMWCPQLGISLSSILMFQREKLDNDINFIRSTKAIKATYFLI